MSRRYCSAPDCANRPSQGTLCTLLARVAAVLLALLLPQAARAIVRAHGACKIENPKYAQCPVGAAGTICMATPTYGGLHIDRGCRSRQIPGWLCIDCTTDTTSASYLQIKKPPGEAPGTVPNASSTPRSEADSRPAPGPWPTVVVTLIAALVLTGAPWAVRRRRARSRAVASEALAKQIRQECDDHHHEREQEAEALRHNLAEARGDARRELATKQEIINHVVLRLGNTPSLVHRVDAHAALVRDLAALRKPSGHLWGPADVLGLIERARALVGSDPDPRAAGPGGFDLPEPLTEAEQAELSDLRRKVEGCGLGDRPQSPAVATLRRLAELEGRERAGKPGGGEVLPDEDRPLPELLDAVARAEQALKEVP